MARFHDLFEVSVVVNIPGDLEDCFHVTTADVPGVIATAKADNPEWTSMVVTICRASRED